MIDDLKTSAYVCGNPRMVPVSGFTLDNIKECGVHTSPNTLDTIIVKTHHQ